MKLAALTLLLGVLAACGGSGAAPTAAAGSPVTTSPTAPQPISTELSATVTVSGTATTFQGGDDHMVLRVLNHGRRIENFVVSAGGWLSEHSFAMGSTRLCDQDSTAQYIDCGPIEAGATQGFTIRSIPNAVGQFEFTFRPFERSGGGLVPIPDAGAPQALVLREEVTPVTLQIPGYKPEPSASAG